MATFSGVDLFGSVCTVKTVQAPRRRQMTRYPGVNGIASKDMGGDGGVSVVDGWLYAPTTGGLDSAEATIRGYQYGTVPQVFVNNYGDSFNNVLLNEFETDDRVYPLAGGQGFARRFRAIFLHLS
jgi:hypothetical protein